MRQQKSQPLADTFEAWLRAKLALISQKGKLPDADGVLQISPAMCAALFEGLWVGLPGGSAASTGCWITAAE